MNKYLVKIFFILLGAGVFLTGSISKAESVLTSAEYITDIRIVGGDASVESAIESGWKVMSESIDGSMIAYRTGDSASDALKNLCFIASESSTENIGDISYQELGSIGGMTLYGTTDSAAGGAIVSIRVIDEPLLGDGTHTVRNKNGEVKELGGDRYLATTHAGHIGMYISDIERITAGSVNSAIHKAANHGFDFYRLIQDDGNEVELIAFNRTDNENKAVRGIYAVNKSKDYTLYYSISLAAGAPIMDIEQKEVVDLLWDNDGSLVGEWAKMAADPVNSYKWNPISVFADKEELGKALKDHSQGTESLKIVVAQRKDVTVGDGKIELAGVDMSTFLLEEDIEEPEKPMDEEVKSDEHGLTDDTGMGASDKSDSDTSSDKSDSDTASDKSDGDMASDAPAGDMAYDESVEKAGTEPEAEETNEDGDSDEGDDEGETTGSLIGSGNIFMIIVGALILVMNPVVGLIYKRRKKGGSEDEKKI